MEFTDKEIIEWLDVKRRKFKRWREDKGVSWRYIKQGVRNLKLWFPVIWFDRWWDHSFLYPILRKKLSLMEEGFRKHGHSTNSKKDAENIKKCVLLLDRLINDGYIDYRNERGWAPKEKLSYYKEERMINQDLDMLFKIMRKQIRCWWD